MKPGIDSLQELVSIQLGRRDVRPEHAFAQDLGAESADLVNLIVAVEDRYTIEISEEQAASLRTVLDLWRLIEALA